MGFIFITIALLGFIGQDLNLKLCSDRYEYYFLKMPIANGIVGIILYIIASIFSESGMGLWELVITHPLVLISEIFYMIAAYVSYVGAGLMEMSIYAPLESVDVIVTLVLLMGYFIMTNDMARIQELLNPNNIIGTILIVGGVTALAILQNKYAREYRENGVEQKKQSKKKYGALVFLFPLSYCMLDGVSGFIDSITLATDNSQSIGTFDYMRIDFLITITLAVIAWCILSYLKKQPFPVQDFLKKENLFIGLNGVLAVTASAAYPFAVELAMISAAILFNAYSAITILLCRIIFKEKLSRNQYLCIVVVVIGIVLVTIAGI